MFKRGAGSPGDTMNGMNEKKQGRTAFSLVIDADEVRVRKPVAPAGKVLPGKRDKERDKKPRRRPDYLEETE